MSPALSTFEPALNASIFLPISTFPEPIDPDIYHCGQKFYSDPTGPSIFDCRAALRQLPQGIQPVPWYSRRGPGVENVLPIIVKHGTSLL